MASFIVLVIICNFHFISPATFRMNRLRSVGMDEKRAGYLHCMKACIFVCETDTVSQTLSGTICLLSLPEAKPRWLMTPHCHFLGKPGVLQDWQASTHISASRVHRHVINNPSPTVCVCPLVKWIRNGKQSESAGKKKKSKCEIFPGGPESQNASYCLIQWDNTFLK